MLMALVTVSTFAQKYVGGDISLLPSYEQNGSQYMDKDGKPISVLPFCKQQGMNAMRVRIFVDPSKATDSEKGEGVVQGLKYVKGLAEKIKSNGFKLLLDFHYSDTWADPAKQWTPDAWKTLDDAELQQQVYEYTKSVFDTLKNIGCAPDFIQTGNEISYGMLWGERNTLNPKKCYEGNDANWQRFANLLKKAGKACREVCPDAKIILHVERIPTASTLYNFYNKMAEMDVDYDIIGLSYYPYFHGYLSTLDDRLTNLAAKFPTKKVWIVETGYYHKWQPSSVSYDYSATYPISDEGQRNFASDLVTTLNKHSNVEGLFWWMMDANEYGHTGAAQTTTGWYNAGLWDNETGRALPALYELKNFLTTDNVENVSTSTREKDNNWYDLSGRRVKGNTTKGILLHKRKKLIFKLK